jgi:hypothetical protein
MTKYALCRKQLDTLFQQALFFSTMHYVGNCPLSNWAALLMGTARGWYKLGEFTAHLHAHQKLQYVLYLTLALHPRNAQLLSLDYVVHPEIWILDDEELAEATTKSWHLWYRDVVVGWFEEVGVKTRLAIDMADLIIDNMDVARDFFNTLHDPLECYQRA